MTTQKPVTKKQNELDSKIEEANQELDKIVGLIEVYVDKTFQNNRAQIQYSGSLAVSENSDLKISFYTTFKGITIFHKRTRKNLLVLTGIPSSNKSRFIITSITSEARKDKILEFHKPSVGKVNTSTPKEIYKTAARAISFYGLNLPAYPE